MAGLHEWITQTCQTGILTNPLQCYLRSLLHDMVDREAGWFHAQWEFINRHSSK
jgi:hypothetical protein